MSKSSDRLGGLIVELKMLRGLQGNNRDMRDNTDSLMAKKRA